MARLERGVGAGGGRLGIGPGRREASNGGRLLRLFIDKPGGVDLEDCAAVSRHLTRLLAVERVDYERLEEAYPGLDPALRKARAFARFAWHKAVEGIRKPPTTARRRFVGVPPGASVD